nr:hypothetical protein [Tanacetum cinerariifolium]
MRPQAFQHVIKHDASLGNLKITNKGAKDLVFGMTIPPVMLNDDIKASVEYSEHLKKSKGSNPLKVELKKAKKASKDDSIL